MASNRLLPLLEPDDLVLLHDTGAYYFSTPFHYNSLPMTAVYGFQADAAGNISFQTFRAQETVAEIVASNSPPR